MLPPCSEWRYWEGVEVEGGDLERGARTLFIRDATLDELVPLNRSYDRVWFTKEFNTWFIVIGMIEQGKDVNIEVTPETIERVPTFVLLNSIVWAKLGRTSESPRLSEDGHHIICGDHRLDAGMVDFVSIGEPYREAFFVVEERRLAFVGSARPEDYSGDVNLE